MSKSPEDLIRELESGGVLDAQAGPPARSTGTVARPPQSKGPVAAKPRARASTTLFILLAVVLVAALGSLPVVSLALYPFSLFVTLIHESWHALVTVASGGTVDSIQISSDLSGLLQSRGGIGPLIASAGYVGAAATGAAALVTPLRYARGVIGTLAAVPLLALIFFHPASAFTAIWCVVFVAALGVAAWKLSTRLLAFLQIFLATEIVLNALRDLSTLIFISSADSHMQTDATNMSHSLFGPSILWSVVWTALSVLVLAAALYRVGRSDLHRLTSRF
jgi:hypothetical protein